MQLEVLSFSKQGGRVEAMDGSNVNSIQARVLVQPSLREAANLNQRRLSRGRNNVSPCPMNGITFTSGFSIHLIVIGARCSRPCFSVKRVQINRTSPSSYQ